MKYNNNQDELFNNSKCVDEIQEHAVFTFNEFENDFKEGVYMLEKYNMNCKKYQ